MNAKSIGAALIFAASCGSVWAQSEPVVIGVLNDMSSTFADQSGPGSVVAARMAIDEVGGTVLGRPIKLLSGDHQNKPDIAASLARRWYDTEGVQLVVDTPNSGTALAVQEVAKQAGRINIVTTAGSVALTNKSCSPTGFHWMWDTYSNSYGLVKALAKNSANTWYFITADYAFGHALEADFRKAVEQTGGKVIGASKHPVGMQDFSALVLAAQASGAKTVVVANGGNDIVNTLKAASEFGLQKSGIGFVAPATFLTDVKSMGLGVAQGLTYITGFTWSLDDRSRAFADKFFERHKAMPTMGQAGVYPPCATTCERSMRQSRSTPRRSRRKCGRCPSRTQSSVTAPSPRTDASYTTCISSRSPVRQRRLDHGIWSTCAVRSLAPRCFSLLPSPSVRW